MDIFEWIVVGFGLVSIAVAVRFFRQINRERAAAVARIEASLRAGQSFKDAWFEHRNRGTAHRSPPPPPQRSVKSSAVGKSPNSATVDDYGMPASQLGPMSGGSWPPPAASYSGGGGTFDGGGSSGDWSSSSSSSSCSSSDSSSSSSSDSGSGSCGGD